ncbi:AraC-like DNA-binding protein [Deinococcus metalli]|uniref:AraC family transcriptional regulator n=1 Tax=Deinococcus metalli TaxID=1141878 RepID=A0A7W8KJX9_9DEIO|nr:AraC family transcriptional regulator [Deinococcus metalli]MBB5377894.1 AraC-like DNA-binding protein [Deinococcus metalli]GHF55251.1 AraC family transcriptional regulator [Deinococcus metalli]
MTRRFAVELGWRTLLRDLNVRELAVLRRAGLPDDLFSRPGQGLDTGEYFRFWLGLEAEVRDPLLPLRVMETITTELFSPPLFAALCSATLVQAAHRLATYKALIAPMELDVRASPSGTLTLTPRWLEAVGDVPVIVTVTELAFFVRLARMATRDRVPALEVTLPDLPARSHMPAYTEFFGVRVTRGERPSITFGATDAVRPFLTENAAMWQVFEPELRRRLSDIGDRASMGERVSAVLLELLPGGAAGIDVVAARLNVSTRTLQRRLDAEGVTFRALINVTREKLARHYLTRTVLSGAEIAFLLGFTDPNSFFRAFREWTGVTPDTVRRVLT